MTEEQRILRQLINELEENERYYERERLTWDTKLHVVRRQIPALKQINKTWET